MVCIKCRREVVDAPYCCMCGAPQSPPARRAGKRGNGLGTAYKRGKTWTGVAPGYSYTVKADDGTQKMIRRRPTKGGFPTKRDALLWASSYEDKGEAESPKLIDLWTGYSENDMTKLSKAKQTSYRIARRRLEPIISRRIDSLTLDQLQSVLNTQCTSYYTAKDVRDLLSNLYKRAMASNENRGKVSLNLAGFLVLPELEEKEAEPFTQDEVKKLWDAYEGGDVFVGYILLLLYTGMMPVELFDCKKDMIDLERCEIYGCGHKTKRRKVSAIVFPDFIKPILQDMIDRVPSDKLLRMNRDNFYKAYHASLAAAGVRDLPPYSCRHTYGTEAVKLAVQPAVIAQMLRHASTKTQERYTHLGTEEAHDAANRLQKRAAQDRSRG